MSGKSLSDIVSNYVEEYRNQELELQILAFIIRKDFSISLYVKKEWFTDLILSNLFSIVREMRCTVTKQILLLDIKGKVVESEYQLYVDTIEDLFSLDISSLNSKNIFLLIDQIVKLYEAREILNGCIDILSSAKDFNLDTAKSKIKQLSRLGGSQAVIGGFYLDDYEKRRSIIQSKANDPEEASGVLTGIYRFDVLTGGLMKGEFGVILGKTGIGKTAALIEFGVNAWEAGKNVMIVSGEMDRESLEFRIDSRLTGIHGLKFRNAALEDDDFYRWDSVMSIYKASKDNFLYIGSYPRKFTTEVIEQDILRLQDLTGKQVDVLCLDYINIMKPLRYGKSGNWEDQSEAVWDFKGLVAEYNLVGWTAGQIKDDAYEKELYDAQDAKYARAISEAAPVIVALIQTAKDVLENRMRFQVLKMRNASPPSLPILLYPNLSIMRLDVSSRHLKTLRGLTANVLEKA